MTSEWFGPVMWALGFASGFAVGGVAGAWWVWRWLDMIDRAQRPEI